MVAQLPFSPSAASFPTPVVHGLTAAEYIKELKGLGEAVTVPKLRQAPMPALRERDSDEDIDGDIGILPVPPAAAPVDGPPAAPAGPPVAPPGAPLVDPEEESVDGAEAPILVWPDQILGRPLTVEGHRHVEDIGLRVACGKHAGCRCFRTIRLDTERYGPMAPIYFLGAWLQGSERQGPERDRTWKPKDSHIRAYIAEHG